MHILSALFDRSAPDLDSCPDESLPEFAFIGRSNVGKSSLLNMLAGKEGLARVSPTPGFTKMINFFTINGNWRLVDLPGYGFAQVGSRHKSRFTQAVADYLEKRGSLICIFALVDSQLPPQPNDLDFIQWLAGISAPFVLVFTKTDRSGPDKVVANIAAFQQAISDWFETAPPVLTCSSKTGQGRSELLRLIGESLPVEVRKAKPARTKKPPARNAPW